MTISSSTRRAGPYTSTGTGPFSFSFKVFDETDIRVVKTDTDSVETDLVITTDYTVSLNADQNATPGGTITLIASQISGEKTTILGALESLQETDIQNAGGFYPEVIENAIDKTTMLIQQLEEESDRSLRLPVSAATADTTLPVPETGMLIGWNDAADGLQNVAPADLLTIAGSSGFSYEYFNGGAASYTLSENPGSISNLEVFVSGVRQWPVTDYAISGTTLTSTTPWAAGTNNVFVRWGQTLGIGVPSDTSVTAAKISDNAVTTAKISDNAVTNAKLATMAANTVKANATAGAAVPSDVALAASQLLGRGSSGNIAPITMGTNLSISGTAMNVSSGILSNVLNFTAQTVALTSISNASPAVATVSSAAQLPENGSPIQLTTSGTLPTGLSLATTYYVINASGTTFNVSATKGGSAINTSGAGSGTHTMNSVYVKGSESFIIVEGWGAGGGGGGVTATTSCGGGGGAGGYFRKLILAASLGSTETVTIGAGGTAGANTGGTGGTGGTTSFGAHASATGGAGGVGNSTGTTPVGGAGGVGSSGDLNLQGQPGFPTGYAFDATRMMAGAGGCTTLGGAGLGSAGTVGTAAGNAGKVNSGSGASGAVGATANVGGVGGSGRVIVYVYS